MIVYASRTGNVRSIVQKLALPNVEITPNLIMGEPFLLFTYTDGLGNIPEVVAQFLVANHALCNGVIASGNSNFGPSRYCGAADEISRLYNVPIVRKLELRGFQHDYDAIIDYYDHQFKSEVLS